MFDLKYFFIKQLVHASYCNSKFSCIGPYEYFIDLHFQILKYAEKLNFANILIHILLKYNNIHAICFQIHY